MLTVNKMTRWQAFMWLWRHDSEARWHWFKCCIMRADLRKDVTINLRDYGACGQQSSYWKHWKRR